MLLSDSLEVTPTQLWKIGVYDSYLGIDSLLHVDPARLRSTKIPELRGSCQKFHDYFISVLNLIAAAKPNDALERQAIKKLIFPEVPEAALGYAQTSNRGHGVTKAIAKRLYATAKTIIDAGINNPSIFEVAVLFEEKFGPDLISDMSIFLMLDELSNYNKRVANNLGLRTCLRYKGGKSYTCVQGNSGQQPVLLIPNSILADLPLATDWSEIDSVCQYNDSLRKRINELIQSAWGKRVKRITKHQIKSVLLSHPSLLNELLVNYSKAKAEAYNFEADPRGIYIWHQASRDFAKNNPLPLNQVKTVSDVFNLVRVICKQFKHLIEEKGLCDLLFDSEGRPKIEKASQLLFFGIADSYCVANNIDITREPETGRGPADFKLSRGHAERVIVEVKLSSNGRFIDGLTDQLPTYLKAEKATNGLLLVIQIGDHEKKIDKLRKVHRKLKSDGVSVPELFIINAVKKPSASKIRGKLPSID